MLALDDMQHHIKRCNSAGTGYAAPIMDEQRFCHMYFWVALLKKLKHLPMHGCTVIG
jgi:hypothetical protein